MLVAFDDDANRQHLSPSWSETTSVPADGRLYFAGLALSNLLRSQHSRGRQNGFLNRAVDFIERSPSRSTMTRAESTALLAREKTLCRRTGYFISLSSLSTFEETTPPRSSEWTSEPGGDFISPSSSRSTTTRTDSTYRRAGQKRPLCQRTVESTSRGSLSTFRGASTATVVRADF